MKLRSGITPAIRLLCRLDRLIFRMLVAPMFVIYTPLK